MCDLYICDSPFLLIFNSWLNPLFKIGYKLRLEEDDMYSMLPEDRSQHLGEELQGWAQAAGRRGKDWEFPCVAKVVLWGALPSSTFSWASFPWHSTFTCFRLTLGLTHFGSWGAYILCAFLEVERTCSQDPGGQTLSLEVGSLEEGVCSLELLMTLWIQKRLGRNLFPETETFPSRPVFLALQGLRRSSFRHPVSNYPEFMGYPQSAL